MNVERLAKRASSLRLSAFSLAENMRQGNFKSLYRGQGIEFSDVRDYLPGDNVRAIDWNVTARMGRAFIKQYEEDRELSVLIILDCSSSMESNFGNTSKLSKAIEAASLLLFACEQNHAAVGTVFFDGKIQFSCEPKTGRENAMVILSKLDKIENRADDEKANGSVLPNALKGAGKLLKKRSLVFVISDFMSAKWETPMANLSQKHDVVPIFMTDSSDFELPELGTVSFYDTETQKKGVFPTNSKKFKSEWKEFHEKKIEAWRDFCVKHGSHPVILDTNEDCVAVLERVF